MVRGRDDNTCPRVVLGNTVHQGYAADGFSTFSLKVDPGFWRRSIERERIGAPREFASFERPSDAAHERTAIATIAVKFTIFDDRAFGRSNHARAIDHHTVERVPVRFDIGY